MPVLVTSCSYIQHANDGFDSLTWLHKVKRTRSPVHVSVICVFTMQLLCNSHAEALGAYRWACFALLQA